MNIGLITRLSKSGELTAPKITERIAKIWIAHLAAPLGIKNVKLNLKTKEYIKENSQIVEINNKVIPGFNCINYAFYVIDPSICLANNKSIKSQSMQTKDKFIEKNSKQISLYFNRISSKG